MKSISVREFKKFCDSMNICRYIWASDNDEDKLEFANLEVVFPDVIVSNNQSSICFRDHENILVLKSVKKIIMGDETTIGVPFSIICSNEKDASYSSKFTIVAQ